MKTGNVRWRAIIKSAEKVCPRKMSRYYWAEETEIIHGVRVISEKEEMSLLETLHSYGNSIERTAKFDIYANQKEWIQELSNFTD